MVLGPPTPHALKSKAHTTLFAVRLCCALIIREEMPVKLNRAGSR